MEWGNVLLDEAVSGAASKRKSEVAADRDKDAPVDPSAADAPASQVWGLGFGVWGEDGGGKVTAMQV